MSKRFGTILREYRTNAGKSLSELARHLGVSVAYVYDVELGKRTPFTKENILKAAEFLRCNPRPLLAAAAEWSGSFTLEARRVSPKAREVGAHLAYEWVNLSDQELDVIASVLKRRETIQISE